jgi:hypothetical protein
MAARLSSYRSALRTPRRMRPPLNAAERAMSSKMAEQLRDKVRHMSASSSEDECPFNQPPCSVKSRLEASPTLDVATKARESQLADLDLTSHVCFLS